jgi:hypothetical protein
MNLAPGDVTINARLRWLSGQRASTRPFVVLLTLSVLWIAIVFASSSILAYGYAAGLAVVAFFSPLLSLCGIVIALPTTTKIFPDDASLLWMLLFSSFNMGLLARIGCAWALGYNILQRLSGYNVRIALGILIMMLAIMAGAFNPAIDYTVRYVLLLLPLIPLSTGLLLCFLPPGMVDKDIVLSGLAFAGMVSLVSLLEGQSITESMRVTSENVSLRVFASAVAFSSLSLTLLQFRIASMRRLPWLIYLMFMIISLLGLLGTASRGALIALVLALIYFSLMFANPHKRKNIPLFRFFWAIVLLVSALAMVNTLTGILSPDLAENIQSRFSNLFASERWQFWRAGFVELPLTGWLFGGGPAYFEHLSWIRMDRPIVFGAGYNAHSSFIDLVFSGGLVALAGMVMIIHAVLMGAGRCALPMTRSLVLLWILYYSSHGDILSLPFWTIFLVVTIVARSEHLCSRQAAYNIPMMVMDKNG